MINIISATRRDFNGLAAVFNDSTWSYDNMQNYFKRIEHNLYLPPLASPDHGFDGWLKTSLNPVQILLEPMFFGWSTQIFIRLMSVPQIYYGK
jgi:choline dehydrogenase